MKKALAALGMVMLASCGSSTQMSPNEAAARECGQADAQKAIDAKPGTMEQERAVIAIKVRYNDILAAGDTLAAEAYQQAAKARLDSAGVLK